MSWIETVLDSESTSNAAAIANKISNAFETEENPKKIDPLLRELKRIAAKLSQAADEINSTGLSSKVIAGAMILLEMRLQETLITPETFTTQEDQDYIQSVIRQIRGQGNKLITQLSSTDQDEVREMLLNARRMADYGYYVRHYQQGKSLSDAAVIADNIGWRNSLLGLSVLWGGYVLLLVILALFPIYMLTHDQHVSAYIGFAFLVIIGAVSFVVLTRIQKAGLFKEAMAIIEELGDVVDLERFDALHEELGGNRNRAVGFQKSAQNVIEKFFAGFPIPVFQADSPGENKNLNEPFDEGEMSNADVDEEDIPPLPKHHPRGGKSEHTPGIRRETTPPAPVPAAKEIASQGIPQFCGECGTRVPSGAVFCPNCGHRLRS